MPVSKKQEKIFLEHEYIDLISRKVTEIAYSHGYKKLLLNTTYKTSKFKKVKDFDTSSLIMFDYAKEKNFIKNNGILSFLASFSSQIKDFPDSEIHKLFYIGKFVESLESQSKIKKINEFSNFGFSVIGNFDHVTDVELIQIAHEILTDLGLECRVRVNITGCVDCIKNYRKILSDYLKTKKGALCSTCAKNVIKNPFSVLSCTNKSCQKIIMEAPLIVDHLCESCNNYSLSVVEFLDDINIPYILDPKLIDSDGIYNSVIYKFEITNNNDSYIIGEGGHFTELAGSLSCRHKVCGFDLNFEQIIKRLKDYNVPINIYNPDVYIAQIGELARKEVILLFKELRQKGVSVYINATEKKLMKQISEAKTMKAKLMVIIGQEEIQNKTAIIRDISDNVQEVINFNKLNKEIYKRLIDKIF
ncbi:ATP phosphoribosyltransferase regulatory subunit, partial [Patescibacteria group bacterium]|nr:ATP phosphoribosyltransferase regulatory subunit [Patescibacteria group bacterium]